VFVLQALYLFLPENFTAGNLPASIFFEKIDVDTRSYLDCQLYIP